MRRAAVSAGDKGPDGCTGVLAETCSLVDVFGFLACILCLVIVRGTKILR